MKSFFLITLLIGVAALTMGFKPPLQLCAKYMDGTSPVKVSYHEYHPFPEYSGKVFLHYKSGETKVLKIPRKNVSIERIILSDRVLIRAKSLNPTN